MEHNEHKTVHVAEAKPLLSDLRALESSSELWRVLESSGELWRALESSGELWRALESSGELWRVLESSGELWRALQSYTCLGGRIAAAPSTFTLGLRIRQVGRKCPPFKIVFWS